MVRLARGILAVLLSGTIFLDFHDLGGTFSEGDLGGTYALGDGVIVGPNHKSRAHILSGKTKWNFACDF